MVVFETLPISQQEQNNEDNSKQRQGLISVIHSWTFFSPVCRWDDSGAGVQCCGSAPLYEHTERWFLLWWQVQSFSITSSLQLVTIMTAMRHVWLDKPAFTAQIKSPNCIYVARAVCIVCSLSKQHFFTSWKHRYLTFIYKIVPVKMYVSLLNIYLGNI